MPQIEWDPALETGEESVDGQHQALIRLFNELIDAELTGSQSNVADVLEKLSDYVNVHFATEERYMAEAGIPAEIVEPHIAEHRKLTARTRDLVLEYRAGQVESVLPIVEFLTEWLATHIERSDRTMIGIGREKRAS